MVTTSHLHLTHPLGTDVVILNCGGYLVPVKRKLLVECSPFFARALNSPFKDRLDLPGHCPNGMMDFINLLRHRPLRVGGSQDDMSKFFNMYHIAEHVRAYDLADHILNHVHNMAREPGGITFNLGHVRRNIVYSSPHSPLRRFSAYLLVKAFWRDILPQTEGLSQIPNLDRGFNISIGRQDVENLKNMFGKTGQSVENVLQEAYRDVLDKDFGPVYFDHGCEQIFRRLFQEIMRMLSPIALPEQVQAVTGRFTRCRFHWHNDRECIETTE